MPKDSNLEKCVLEGDSVEQNAMKKEEEKEMTEEEKETKFLKDVGQKDYSKYSKEELLNLSDEEQGDWFIWRERKRYEEWLEQPTPFPIKVHNWWYKFKYKWIKNWIKEGWDSYKWNHGGKEKHFAPGGVADRYSHYMRSVHECYKREEEKERLMTKEEREKYQKGKREAIETIMLEAEKRRGVKENNRQV